MKNIKIYVLVLFLALQCSCKEYLDFVPDNIATVDDAFAMRSTAERYLYTCYSFMPLHGDLNQNPAFLGGDEMMVPVEMLGVDILANDFIAHGLQNVVNPYLNYWDGINASKALYKGISTCNIFLENVGKVPGLNEDELRRWTAEAKFLKAYYHYWLFRMYGPIVLVKENIPVTSEVDEFYVKRAPVDRCVEYMVQLLDEAVVDLPIIITNTSAELGRITKPIALSIKAEVLTTAASPLFNGNPDYAGFKNRDGELLFNPAYEAEKWVKAANACKEAIDMCHQTGLKLNQFQPSSIPFTLPLELSIQMGLRNSVTEKWNPEIIWANTQSWTSGLGNSAIQANAQARIDETRIANFSFKGFLAPTLKMAELFYSENGVPIEEDKTWNYNERYDLKTATAADQYYIKQGYRTAALHFDREPRFYSSLGFDGGIWYGQGRLDPNSTSAPLFHVQAKLYQAAGGSGGERYSGTGYWPKKLVNYKNIIGPTNTYDIENYPWPVMRLADLYLLYAEALNETGDFAGARNYTDLVRARAGLQTIEKSWDDFSRNPAKYTTKEGLRNIIHQERLIELAFEGKRFWDIRRWKDAPRLMNSSVKGWDINQEETALYYRVRTLFTQTFQLKDYFWPIRESELIINKNLVQNPGW